MLQELPTELVYIILKMLDSTTLRNLRKVSQFSQYSGEIGKLLSDNMAHDVKYHTFILNKHMYKNLELELNENEVGLELDSERWPQYMINQSHLTIIFNRGLMEIVKSSEYISQFDILLEHYKGNKTRLQNIILPRQRIISDYERNIYGEHPIRPPEEALLYAKRMLTPPLLVRWCTRAHRRR